METLPNYRSEVWERVSAGQFSRAYETVVNKKGKEYMRMSVKGIAMRKTHFNYELRGIEKGDWLSRKVKLEQCLDDIQNNHKVSLSNDEKKYWLDMEKSAVRRIKYANGKINKDEIQENPVLNVKDDKKKEKKRGCKKWIYGLTAIGVIASLAAGIVYNWVQAKDSLKIINHNIPQPTLGVDDVRIVGEHRKTKQEIIQPTVIVPTETPTATIEPTPTPPPTPEAKKDHWGTFKLFNEKEEVVLDLKQPITVSFSDGWKFTFVTNTVSNGDQLSEAHERLKDWKNTAGKVVIGQTAYDQRYFMELHSGGNIYVILGDLDSNWTTQWKESHPKDSDLSFRKIDLPGQYFIDKNGLDVGDEIQVSNKENNPVKMIIKEINEINEEESANLFRGGHLLTNNFEQNWARDGITFITCSGWNGLEFTKRTLITAVIKENQGEVVPTTIGQDVDALKEIVNGYKDLDKPEVGMGTYIKQSKWYENQPLDVRQKIDAVLEKYLDAKKGSLECIDWAILLFNLKKAGSPLDNLDLPGVEVPSDAIGMKGFMDYNLIPTSSIKLDNLSPGSLLIIDGHVWIVFENKNGVVSITDANNKEDGRIRTYEVTDPAELGLIVGNVVWTDVKQ